MAALAVIGEATHVRVKAHVAVNVSRLIIPIIRGLDDLAHAVALDPKNTMYWAELASANLKVKKFNEAIISSQECLRLDDKVSEAYLILGVSLAETGKKTEGLENMRKAQELGNEQAASFIEKYK